MSALGIGTAAFDPGYGIGGASSAVPGVPLLRRAVDAGVRYLDTAPAYADAEWAIGASGVVAVPGIRVCTKLGVRGQTSAAALVPLVRASLTRLATHAVDTIMFHSADAQALRDLGVAGVAAALGEQGLAMRVGASTYGLADALAAIETDWCGAVQVEFSVLNQSIVPALVRARRPGQEIVVRSVLCKGLLTGRRHLARELLAPVADTVDAIEALARDWGYTLPQLAIRFALDTPGVDVVVVGVSTDEELTTALEAWAVPPLTDAHRDALAAFDRSDVDQVHPERWRHLASN